MSPVLRPLRKREEMPDFVREALERYGLRPAYDARPPYQRNDYLLWINKVKREDTKRKHLAQMLDELRTGGVYMRMPWRGLKLSTSSADRPASDALAPRPPARHQ